MEQKANTLTIQFTVALTGQMLKEEQLLQQSLNEAGRVIMMPMIKQFDTDGEPIRVNGVKHTIKDYGVRTMKRLMAPYPRNAIPTKPAKGDMPMCRWKMMHAWS